MRVLITFALFLGLGLQSVSAQNTYTDGLEYHEYSNDEFFEIFKKKFWVEKMEKSGRRLRNNLSKKILLVKLRDHAKQIKFHADAGHHKAVEKYKKEDTANNNDIIKAMSEFYQNGELYYYYAKDSDRILLEHDFTALLDKELKPAQNVHIDSSAYVLMLSGTNLPPGRKVYLHYWDVEDQRIIKLRDVNFMLYKSIWSELMDYYDTYKDFCKWAAR